MIIYYGMRRYVVAMYSYFIYVVQFCAILLPVASFRPRRNCLV